MPYLLIKHKVKDFEKWYAIFKATGRIQKEYGIHDIVLLKEISDANLIFCLFKVDNIEKAKSLIYNSAAITSSDLTGIIGEPEHYFLEKI